jgi:hypothetical protein
MEGSRPVPDAIDRVISTHRELRDAQAEERLASDMYAGDEDTEDWHRCALTRMLICEDAFRAACADWLAGADRIERS